MSNLIAIAYPDVATAEEVRNVLVQDTKEQLIVLDDAVVVSRQQDCKVKLHQGVSLAGAGAAGGALWGGLILRVRSSTPDKVLPRVQQYGGHVIQTSLSSADEERLKTALGERVPAS